MRTAAPKRPLRRHWAAPEPPLASGPHKKVCLMTLISRSLIAAGLVFSATLAPAAFGPASLSLSAHDEHTTAIVGVETAWARTTGWRTVSAAVYLTLHNLDHDALTLTSVSTEAAETVEIHNSFMEDGIMRMQPAGALTIPQDGTLEMAPGGLHVMLTKLRAPLAEGDVFPITLHIEGEKDITVHVSVTGIAGPNAGSHSEQHTEKHPEKHSEKHTEKHADKQSDKQLGNHAMKHAEKHSDHAKHHGKEHKAEHTADHKAGHKSDHKTDHSDDPEDAAEQDHDGDHH